MEGRTIPVNADSGQVHWSIDGDEPLGLIGRVEQVDIAKGISMTAACAECCPDSWYSFWINPLAGAALPGNASQFTAMEQDITCYGEILDPFQVFPGNFTSTDPSVASCNSSGFTTAQSMGTANIGASWTVRFWDFDLQSGGCTRYLETANPDAICDVVGIRGYVSNPPVTGDGDAVVAGQEFTLTAEIVYVTGERATSFNGSAAVAVGGTAHSGETIPSGVSISSGVGSAQVKLQAVDATGNVGRTYHLTFTDASSGSTNFGGTFKLYFPVTMDVENWKNCDFVSCPNLGSYFCTTACSGGYAQPTEFLALTANACHSNIRIVNPANGRSASTAAEDIGPTTNNSYWTSGSRPSIGGCVTDALADTLGISHGCNPNHGQAAVYWRFE